MTQQTEAKPDLWNTDDVREQVAKALARSAGDSQADAVMEVLRDLIAQIACTEQERSMGQRQVIYRLQDHVADLRAQLALVDNVDRGHHEQLTRLMVNGRPVNVTDREGRVRPWTAKIAGLADHPTVVLDCADGRRRVLPQTFTYTEA